MPLQALTHDAPAESWSVRNRNIRVVYAQHALLDEVEHFSIERRLQAVGHMARKFLPQLNRLLPDRRVERHRLLNDCGRCLATPDDFHERDDVRRVEWVPDEDTLGVLALRLHDTRR